MVGFGGSCARATDWLTSVSREIPADLHRVEHLEIWRRSSGRGTVRADFRKFRGICHFLGFRGARGLVSATERMAAEDWWRAVAPRIAAVVGAGILDRRRGVAIVLSEQSGSRL